MQTLASGERVLSLLEEEPEIEEVTGKEPSEFGSVECQNLSFAYEEEQILSDYSISIPKGSRIGLHGKSGSGKSTLLKLLMRFYDTDSGSIQIGGRKLASINTKDLRDMESYVTQETSLFHDSIANNIAVAKPGASRAEIEEAAKKASLHEFIMSLPNGYDTMVGELGDTLSGGEKAEDRGGKSLSPRCSAHPSGRADQQPGFPQRKHHSEISQRSGQGQNNRHRLPPRVHHGGCRKGL